jgi:hypothetical protein
MNKRSFIAIKHPNYTTLAYLESLVEEAGFAPISARSYPVFIDIFLDQRVSTVAVLYHFDFCGEQFPQERRIIYPLEIINNITSYKKNIPLFALSSLNQNPSYSSSLLTSGVREILPYPLTSTNLEQALNRAGIVKPTID